MFKALVKLYLDNKSRFDVIPAFANDMTTFHERNGVIDKLVPLASDDTDAVTKQRMEVLRPKLLVSAMMVARALCGYAASINDRVLSGNMNWTEAKLNALTLDKLGLQADAIFKQVELLWALSALLRICWAAWKLTRMHVSLWNRVPQAATEQTNQYQQKLFCAINEQYGDDPFGK